MATKFDDMLRQLLNDDRTKRIPVLYIVEVLIILEDLDII